MSFTVKKASGTLSNFVSKNVVDDEPESSRTGGIITSSLLAAVGSPYAAGSMSEALKKTDRDFYNSIEFDLGNIHLAGNFYRAADFNDGDEVEIVYGIEKDEDGIESNEVFSIYRPKDHLLVMTMGAELGRSAQVRRALKIIFTQWAFVPFGTCFLILIIGLIARNDQITINFLIYLFAMGFSFFVIGGFFMYFTGVRYDVFHLAAENVFSNYGWNNPKSIDLYEESEKYVEEYRRKLELMGAPIDVFSKTSHRYKMYSPQVTGVYHFINECAYPKKFNRDLVQVLDLPLNESHDEKAI